MDNALAVIIMAAGKGTRLNNPSLAKVMYTIDEKPMIEYVVDLSLQLQASRIVVVVGWQKDSVIQHLARTKKPVVCIEQNPQLGTAHAVMQAESALNGFEGDVLVLSGDVPLLSFATTRALIDFHRANRAAATVLTLDLEDPSGYGRIIRHSDGSVQQIVEQKDATEEQRGIREINSGIYVFEKMKLFQALKHVTPSNKQKEYYLTDVFSYFRKLKLPVSAMVANDPHEVMGINTAQQLEEARAIMSRLGS